MQNNKLPGFTAFTFIIYLYVKHYNMKKLILSFIFIYMYMGMFAQPHRSDIWYFGAFAGLKFSSGTPVALTNGALYTNEGCATISDTSGALLFYTDGVTVWNKNHQVMPHGTNLNGDPSSTQSAIIVTKPGSNTQHYLFTMDEIGGSDGLQYSIVDMTLAGGTGDVDSTNKNIPVEPFMTEKLIAVQKLNTQDFWIAAHKWGTDEFYVYSLTLTGFQSTPIISHTGMVHNTSVIQNTYGQMKFNVCGNRLALAASYMDTVEIFDFDNVTGIVSNPVTLPLTAHVYGVEFSKNSHFLYVSTYDPSATLVQFDLTSGNAATILASKTTLSTTPDIYALQLANDGKIYVTRSWSSYLGVINFPEIAGIGCNYVDNGVNLDPNFTGITSSLGLPAITASYLRGEAYCTITNISESPVNSQIAEIYPNPSYGNFTVQFAEEIAPANIIVYDQAGRVVERLNSSIPSRHLTFGKSYIPGVYITSISENHNIIYKRLIKF